MVQKCCPACCGIGSYLRSKWVQDETGLSIYSRVSVRNPCEVCNGEGRLIEPEKSYTHYCNTRSIRQQPGFARIQLGLDQALGYLILTTLMGYASLLFVKGNFELSGWLKIAIALEASIVLLFILKHFPASTRVLRWSTLMVFLLIVCGGFALEYAR